MRKIFLKVETIEVDKLPYKPMKPVLVPENLYVEVSIPDKEVVEHTNNTMTVITPEGLYFITCTLANAQEIVHDKFTDD